MNHETLTRIVNIAPAVAVLVVGMVVLARSKRTGSADRLGFMVSGAFRGTGRAIARAPWAVVLAASAVMIAAAALLLAASR